MYQTKKMYLANNIEKYTKTLTAIYPFIYQQMRSFRISNGLLKEKDHYAALGVSPKATQADIKAAYYKLSMMYHPDRSQNKDDAQKFRNITDAYEVLGNVKSRKLYDRGLFVRGSPSVSSSNEPTNKFYKSRDERTRPPPTGRTPIYNFDEWSKNHYEATFNMDMRNKRKYEQFKAQRQSNADHRKWENAILGIGVLLLICTSFFNSSSHDVVRNINNTNADSVKKQS